MTLRSIDPQVADALQQELHRQNDEIELIASENYTSEAVMEACGSVATNKYAEGYPKKRYYGGCQHVDVMEDLARERAKKLFGCHFANVQAHSGSQANQAVFYSFLQPGDTFLGMDLASGGHLTHGSPVNLSGKMYNCVSYGLDPKTELIDYDEVERLALEHKPKLIIAGGSAYSRTIDFGRFRSICDKVKSEHNVETLLMVDMAHIAGLVAAGAHPSPIGLADIVTSTTHKTLRGPRGGLVLTNNEDYAKKIDKTIFPGMQGGPLMHIIAAKAVAFGEALQDSFSDYSIQVVKNAKAMEEVFSSRGIDMVSGGTDNHLLLLNLVSKGVTGKDIEAALHGVGITTNKNSVPNDPQKPFVTSGIRIGSPAMTTRGFKEEEFRQVANWICDVIENPSDEEKQKAIHGDVKALCAKFPLYGGLSY